MLATGSIGERRAGLPLIARAPFGLSADDRVQVSYNTFLASSLHRGALEEGRQQCSVSLTFERDDGEPLVMRRIWYFSPDGSRKPADEELRNYRGKAERLEGCPPNEDEAEWRRAFVARELLPRNLASFFLFDGEQVQVLAERDMSARVRAGIGGLLGIRIMKELAADLRKYATNRRSQVGGGRSSPKELDRLRDELLALERDCENTSSALEEAKGELERLGVRRDALLRELAAMGAGAGDTTVKDRFGGLDRVKRTLEGLSETLQKRLTGDLSLGLAGKRLRERAVVRLKAEAIRESWEAGRKSTESGLRRFLEAIQTDLRTEVHALVADQQQAVLTLVRSRWNELWHPALAGCADSYMHSYLRGAEREATIGTLERLARVSNSDLTDLFEQIARADKSRVRLENEFARLAGISSQLEAKTNQLKEPSKEIDRLSPERGVSSGSWRRSRRRGARSAPSTRGIRKR